MHTTCVCIIRTSIVNSIIILHRNDATSRWSCWHLTWLSVTTHFRGCRLAEVFSPNPITKKQFYSIPREELALDLPERCPKYTQTPPVATRTTTATTGGPALRKGDNIHNSRKWRKRASTPASWPASHHAAFRNLLKSTHYWEMGSKWTYSLWSDTNSSVGVIHLTFKAPPKVWHIRKVFPSSILQYQTNCVLQKFPSSLQKAKSRRQVPWLLLWSGDRCLCVDNDTRTSLKVFT